MLRSRWVRALAVTACGAVAVSVPLTSTAANPAPPNLRLLSVLHSVGVDRYKGEKQIDISPGVYLAATGGAFEIDAYRTARGVVLWQVRRDGDGVHKIRQLTPPAPAHMTQGLPDFFRLTMRNSAGRAVAAASLPFCISGGDELARVDASGPDRPTYPSGCGEGITRATVWGLDQGWGTSVDLGMRFPAPDGLYTLTIAITQPYVRQLAIPATAARATVRVRVRTTTTGGCAPALACPVLIRGSARQLGSIAPRVSTEGPRPAAPALTGGGDSGLAGDGVPDLRALPARNLHVTHNRRTGHDYLNFTATVWNGGSGPLVVEGFRNGAAETMPATQFIYQNGKPVSSHVIGRFEYDHRRGHDHWHMADFAQYDLLDKNGKRIVLSGKQSFCLAPTDPVNLVGPGADWQPDQEALWSACDGESAIWLREVLPAGWGDTYVQDVAGQSFDISGLANGTYQVRVTADPLHHLQETSYDNNVGVLTIRLGGTPGHRTATVVPATSVS